MPSGRFFPLRMTHTLVRVPGGVWLVSVSVCGNANVLYVVCGCGLASSRLRIRDVDP
jgi:hypothetical protein